MQRLIICTALLLCSSLTQPAWAIRADLRPLISHYDYRETASTGEQLNRETGGLYGIELAIHGSLTPLWHWQASARELRGDLRYEGKTQAGVPLRTESRYQIRSVDALLIRCFNRCTTHVHLGLGMYQRDRDILPTVTTHRLFEHYNGWHYVLGTEQSWWQEQLYAGISATRTLDNQLQPDLRVIHYGQPTLALPDTWAFQGNMRWRLLATQSLTSSVHLGYRYQHMSRSQSTQVSRPGGIATIFQPENTLHQWHAGLSLGFTY